MISIGRYKRVFLSFCLLFRLNFSICIHSPICYIIIIIIIHFDFFFFFALCMLLKWAECQVRLHKRHARLLMNYSLTIRYMYVYMSVIRSVAAYWHTLSTEKKMQKMKEERSDFMMSDDDDVFFPVISFSIKLLNVLVVIVK